jgi:quercetin dioxygenase-like cupin family protein
VNRRELILAGLRVCALTAMNVGAEQVGYATALAADLALLAQSLLSKLDEVELQHFLDLWPDTDARRPSVASTVPVLRYLPVACDGAPPFAASFAAALLAAAPGLAWRRTYTVDQVGAQFFDNYGWTELVGLTGPVPSKQLACGVLLLGPHVTYPPHHHEADEIYVPLSGTARWRRDTENWVPRRPGSVIHHEPNKRHSMQTGNEPLLALYLWRSNQLDQKSQLDNR